MNFDVEKAIARSAKLVARRDRAQQIIERSKRELDILIDEIADTCRPSCKKAVWDYNRSHIPTIDPTSLCLSFDLVKKTFSLEVRLLYRTGIEPEGRLSSEDTEKYTDPLRPLMKKYLKEAGIELRFDTLIFPEEYYAVTLQRRLAYRLC
jgi:hypothetical protein